MRATSRAGRALLAAWLAGSALFAVADDPGYCVPTRPVPFDDFSRKLFVASVPLDVPVPEGYEVADFGSEAMGYAYWMLPKEMPKAEKSHNLPARTGYMYGRLSLNVGYDAARDYFVGVDEDAAPPGVLAGLKLYRATVGGHELLFMEATLAKMDRKVYMVYVALNIETQSAYIAYIPPKNDMKLGDCHWAAFRASVGAVPVSSKTQRPLAK